jgi:hypothetical protein
MSTFDAYRLMLRAIMLRNGGRLTIEPEEVTEEGFTIYWRETANGGLEARLTDGQVKN